MVYQISEKNQILIALFGIVVLCAGKLFKDYLNRGGYIEGMSVNYETTPRTLTRPASGSGPTTNNTIFLNVTLSATLPANTALTVSWPAAAAGANINLPTAADGYTATNIVSSGTDINLTTGSVVTTSSGGTNVPTSVTFTHTAAINSGEWIRISIKNISISATPASAFDLVFTVTPGSGSAITTTVNIGTAGVATSGGASDGQQIARTANDIRNTIALIDANLAARRSTMSPDDVSALEQSKSALLNMLASTYGTVKEAGQVFDSEALYKAQKTAMDFIKQEKERSSKNAKMLSEDNTNKRRMAQVNTYYTRHYEENTEVMKHIIFVTIALIIMALLRKKELIPESISTLGIILILTFGGITVGTKVYDIIRRNDHDFDKYDWTFNEDEMNKKQLTQQNTDPSNLSEMGMGMAPCYGPGCCDVGTSWDSVSNKCIPGSATVSGTVAWVPSGSSAATGSLTIKITPSVALVAADTVTITLPSGLFTGTPTVTGLTTTTATPTLIVFSGLTVNAGVENTIVVTGLSKSSSSDVSSMTKAIKIKTSKDINERSIIITGI
jgi:hypothetical protein